jgi:hypothetical protein
MEVIMEITPLMLYICTAMDSLIHVVSGLAFASIMASAACVMYMLLESAYTKTVKRLIAFFAVLSVLLMLTSAALPTTKQTAIIFGVPYMMNTLKDTGVAKIPPKMVEYAEVYIDKELLAMKKELDQAREKK